MTIKQYVFVDSAGITWKLTQGLSAYVRQNSKQLLEGLEACPVFSCSEREKGYVLELWNKRLIDKKNQI